MKTKFLLIALLTVILAKATPPLDEGKAIFASRCAACHNINKIVVGPALAGVDKRHTLDWIINFVHSSQTVIKSGDPTANELFNQFNHIQMPNHTDLTAENIKSIVAYIQSEAKQDGEKAPFAKPLQWHPNYTPLSISNNYGFFVSYLGLIALLIAVLLFAVQVKQYERKVNGEE